ncbi:hypothetical protein MOV08_07735 [Streptomyces yunnanensis]|uniref:Uncharacterized protein n=1 Tax=Streptomyces yunnanensis TaxID=156453 RepID=A0ABY8A313_9ACTN|nr:hypothetical protein [Streptomyces yunnanensis]WEB39183.1 hypothetical protein MOV08_07735 [Streptomyces yunnanensis]
MCAPELTLRTGGRLAQGVDLAEIGEVAFTSPDRVRDMVHNFYADGTRLDAAATVIAALHHDNPALRAHLDSHTVPANSPIWTNARVTA